MSNTLKEIRRKLSCQSIVSQSDSQIDEPVDWRDKQKTILSKKTASYPSPIYFNQHFIFC